MLLLLLLLLLLSKSLQPRYLLLQGYTSEGDLAIITPYVGQLQRLKRAVASSNMRVILSDKDSEQLAEVEEAAAAAAAEATAEADPANGGASPGLTRKNSSSGASSSSGPGTGTAGAAGPAGEASVVEMGQCVRLATIDNFQVRHYSTTTKKQSDCQGCESEGASLAGLQCAACAAVGVQCQSKKRLCIQSCIGFRV